MVLWRGECDWGGDGWVVMWRWAGGDVEMGGW